MKISIILSVLLSSVMFISCERTAGTDASTSQVITSGDWRVTQFSERGNDETSDFNGYVFTFSTNGNLIAVKNGVSKTGTWGENTGSNKLNIDLGLKSDSNKPLGELTDDWIILSKSETEIRLTDDNSSSAEFLTFTKN